MDIEGLGEKRVVQLVSLGLVSDPGDIYSLAAEQLVAQERLGELSSDNLLRAIATSKERGLLEASRRSRDPPSGWHRCTCGGPGFRRPRLAPGRTDRAARGCRRDRPGHSCERGRLLGDAGEPGGHRQAALPPACPCRSPGSRRAVF